MAFGSKKDSTNPPADQKPADDSQAATSSSSTSPNDEPAKDPGLHEPTFSPGEQTVDLKESKVLPESSKDEIAPIPDGSPRKARQKASATGYRVAEGHSISTVRDHLDARAEIGPGDVGGQERLDHLVEVGHVDKVETTSDKPERDQTVQTAPAKTPEEQKLVDDAKAIK